MSHGREAYLSAQLFAVLGEGSASKLSAVVGNDPTRDAEPCYNVLHDDAYGGFRGDSCDGLSLNSLGEGVDSDE